MIPQTIRYIEKCKAKAALCIPDWPSAHFWPMLFINGKCYKSYVRDIYRFKPFLFKPDYMENNTFSNYTSFDFIVLNIEF